MADFQLENFTQRSSQLLDRTRGIFDRYADLIGTISTLPQSMQPADGSIKLVFVGQYSAGKSSLIKMLTGEDVKIGAAITTDKSQEYEWGELEIVDTPGIHTGIRADHDERSYYRIDHAALLIFVVTNEGFDDYVGNHFRKLAVEQKRGKNMVLVVNKMDRTALGNVPEQQQIIADDMRKVLTPYTPEQLYLSFVSTEMYFEGEQESDAELRDIYVEQSGHDQFVENLNAFVASRGVLSKVQTPLETLRTSITKVIGDPKNQVSDQEIDAAEELLHRRLLEIKDGERRMRSEVERLAQTCANNIRAEGSNAARIIDMGVTEEEVKQAIDDAQTRAEDHVRECEREVGDRLSSIGAEIDRGLAAIDHSPLSNKLRQSLSIPTEVKSDGISSSPFNPMWVTTKASQASKMGLSVAGLGKFNFASAVKDVGHLFGVKFAPWGATNIVAGAAKVLGWIGVAYTAYQVLDKLLGEDKEAEARECTDEF